MRTTRLRFTFSVGQVDRSAGIHADIILLCDLYGDTNYHVTGGLMLKDIYHVTVDCVEGMKEKLRKELTDKFAEYVELEDRRRLPLASAGGRQSCKKIRS